MHNSCYSEWKDKSSILVSDTTYMQYLISLLAGDRQQCRAIFESCLAADMELRVLYQDLVQRSLYQVGKLWEQGKISVATEHLATTITESLLHLVYPRLCNHPRIGKSAVVSCATNEYHQIGSKMVADFFELNGWRGHYLGANTPVTDLLSLVEDKHPDTVVLSLAVHFNLEPLIQTATTVHAEFPDTPILVGGQGFHWGGRDQVEKIPNVRYLASLDELMLWLKLQT